MSLLNRPSIPPHFTSISHAMGVYYIVHGLMLWLGCGGAGYFLWTQETLPLALRLALVVLFGVVSGLGMFFMALQGHEGFHGNLHSNRDVSMTMGIIASAVAPFFVSVGYNVIHWQHHLHTNTDKDPDYALYRKNDTFLARVLHGPRETMLRCLHNAWRLFAISGDLDRSYPFSKEKARRYAAFNVALMLLMLVAYVAVAIHDLRLFAFFVLIPAVGSQTYWGHHAIHRTCRNRHRRRLERAHLHFVGADSSAGGLHLPPLPPPVPACSASQAALPLSILAQHRIR